MKNDKLIHQLFIGKVADEIGVEKTTKLLREAKEAIETTAPVNTDVGSVSCRDRYKETSKLIDGYSQFESVPRALGFKSGYDIQQDIHKYRHLINASDVETVAKWLFESGYDIIKLPDGN